jgi:hypothetical protein
MAFFDIIRFIGENEYLQMIENMETVNRVEER